MAFLSLKSFRARSAERSAMASALKATLGERFGLAANDALAVNEIACPDPDCPDMETIILVMRAGQPTRALRIRAPLNAVTAEQIEAVVTEEAQPPTQV